MATWAVVCLLLYVGRRYHTAREIRWKNRCAALDEELRGSNAVQTPSQADHAGIREQNLLLRSLLSQSTARHCANLVLRRLVTQPEKEFAAIIHWVGDDQRLLFSRGLNDHSTGALVLPDAVAKQLSANPVLLLERDALYESGILELLSPADRGKVRRLTIVAHHEDGDLNCVLVSTSLFPPDADAGRQRQLARKMLQWIGQRLTAERNNEILTNQLRLTTDMLQLRKVADKLSDTPEMMIGNYLSCLAHQLHAERIALFSGSGMIDQDNKIIRCGEELPAGIATRWKQFEEQLVFHYCNKPILQSVSHAELLRQNIDSLIGSALVIPLIKDGRTVAHICCTRRRTEAFAAPEKDLAVWAAEDFTNAMVRLLSHHSVSREARVDGLTELANRREFDKRIERECERARVTKSPCSLLMFDLDRFKTVNDTYGHQAGDHILQEVSRILQIHVMKCRHEDEALIARYGGEELVILLPGMSEAGALRIGETIREAIAATDFRFRGLTIKVTISAGIAGFHDHATSAATLIAAADSALYSAKQSGRNRVVCASELPRLAELSPAEIQLLADCEITAESTRPE